MDKYQLQKRTMKFALSILELSEQFSNNPKGWVISKQIIRSSTSVAANYRAVCSAKSDKDFISKLGTVIEEADETLFWLELIEESNIQLAHQNIIELKQEANELVSIFVSSIKTIKTRLNQRASNAKENRSSQFN